MTTGIKTVYGTFGVYKYSQSQRHALDYINEHGRQVAKPTILIKS